MAYTKGMIKQLVDKDGLYQPFTWQQSGIHYATLNAHNMYLGLLVNFGIFVYILVIIYLMITLLDNCDYKKILPIFALLLNAYFETSMLWSAIIMFPCLLITFMQKDSKEERRKEYDT